MNPYQPPSSDASKEPLENFWPGKRGLPCKECGSLNTGVEQALRTKPSIIVVLFFGWIFILLRTALSNRTETCRDCGGQWRYRSNGNNLALAALIALLFLITLAVFADA
jgi:hypothetical protein